MGSEKGRRALFSGNLRRHSERSGSGLGLDFRLGWVKVGLGEGGAWVVMGSAVGVRVGVRVGDGICTNVSARRIRIRARVRVS